MVDAIFGCLIQLFAVRLIRCYVYLVRVDILSCLAVFQAAFMRYIVDEEHINQLGLQFFKILGFH